MQPEDPDVEDFKQLTINDLFQDNKASRTQLTYYHDNKILRSHQPVQQFFIEFENYSSSSQATLLTFINQALQQLPTNGRVLADPTILQAAIKICLNNKGRIQSEILTTLSYMFRCSSIPDAIIRKILEKTIVEFYDNRVQHHTLLTTARIFSSMYESKLIGNNQPKNTMYFHGQQDFIVQARKGNMSWPFSKGYTFALWIYLQQIRNAPDMPLGKLFTFHTENSGGLQAYLIDDKLFYRVLGSTYTEPHIGSNGLYLCSIQPRKWHFLAIEHQQPKTLSRSKLNVYLEKRVVNSVSIDPPKPSSSAQTSIRLFNEMYCRTSAVALFLNPVGNKVDELSRNMNSIDYLKDARALVFEPRGGKIYERSWFGWADCQMPIRNRKMNCTHILPFFYLLRFVEASEQPVLNQLLNIIILYLRSSHENQQQAQKISFFKLLANLLTLVPGELFDSNTIKVLLHIKHNITEQKLLDQFVAQFLWKLLKTKANVERKLEIFQVLKNCFTQNLIHFSSYLGFDQILNCIASFEVRSVDCCEKHQRTMQPQLQNFVENKQEQLLVGLLQLMELLFSNTKIDLTVELPKIIRLLCLKFSPCFQLALLTMLRKVLMDKLSDKLVEQHGRKALKTLVERKVHLIFLYLISNSPFVDVKAECLKLIFFLVSQKISTGLSQVDLTHYIAEVLWNINEVKKDSGPINLVKEGSIKQIESKPQRQPQAPQAPSMSNRRNPNLKFTFAENKQTVMEEEKTVDPQVNIKPNKKKKNFSLNIDTDKINQLYSYGGEKGKQVIVGAQEEEEQIENIHKLALKCLKAMRSNQQVTENQGQRRPQIQSVRQNKKINFPVAALNSTRNQDLADRKQRSFAPANLRIIEQSEKSVSEKKSKPRSEVSEQDTRRTPKISPSQKKQQTENMMTLYTALLECIFHKPTPKVISPSPKIVSVPCLEMMLSWGHYFSTEMKTLILTDLTIMIELKSNIQLLSGNQELFNFILSSVYGALASSSEELLKAAVALLSSLFQYIFLTEQDVLPKFTLIVKWQRSPSSSDAYNTCLSLLACRYCWIRIIDAILQSYTQNPGNDILWQNNFNSLLLVTEQLIHSNYNPLCESIEVRQDNNLTYLLNSNDVPLLIRDYFKYEWLDYTAVAKLLSLFNKYFTTKSYLQLKKHSNSIQSLEKFVDASLDNKNNLQTLRDCEYYMNSSHQRGILLSLTGLYVPMVQFCHENNMECEEQEVELVSLGKLILVLGEVMHVKNASGKRQQIIEGFMLVLKTTVCLSKTNELLVFMLTVRNYITTRFVIPGNIDANCYLNLVTLEIVNTYFASRNNLLDLTKLSQTENELRAFLMSIDIDTPKKLQDNQASQISTAKDYVKAKFQIEVYEVTTQTIQTQKQRFFSTNILEEADIRKARSNFRRIWKTLRCYNSVWSHPQFYFQIDSLFNKNIWNFDKGKVNPIYNIRVYKQQSKSKARFLLAPRLIEPKIVKDFQASMNTQKGPIRLQKPLALLSKALAEAEERKQSIVSNKYLSLGKGLLQTFYPLRSQSDSPLVLKKADIVTTLTVRTGSLCITSEKLLFIYSNYQQKQSHFAIVRYKLSSSSSFTKEWPLEHIKQIFRRRYVNRRSALEIFFINGESVFFHFPDGDSEEISKKILRLRQSKCPNIVYNKSLDPKKILENSSLMKKWGNFEVSNFDYLMQVNCLAGRSYKDVTQYHVFPWAITSFAEKLDLSNANSYRDFTKNMGSMGSETRVINFQERYKNVDPHEGGEKFHFGTHYSSPGIIYHYLIRLSPFTEGAKQLQSGKFDFADRLFFSIEDSFKNCTSEYSDVRELIPEFFYLPEMFLNQSKHDFGMMQNKKRVNNVEMPQWARDNPYLYVAKLRKGFELDCVSKSINNWIDLIFGYKQRGEEALKALNVFVHITYEDSVNFETLAEPKLRKAIESQILNFGQTPSQIFIKPHPERSPYSSMNFGNVITSTEIQPKVYRPSAKKQSERSLEVNPMHHPEESIIRLKWIKDSKLICVHRNGNVINYKWYSQGLNRIPFQCAIEKEHKLDRIAKLKYDPVQYYDPSLDLDNFPLEVICSGQYLLIGGLCEGKLVQLESESGSLFETYKHHHDPITCIRSDSKDNFVITGDSSGDVILWRIASQSRLVFSHRFSDHSLKVNSIFISYELRSFATCSEDGSIQLYNIITGKRLRAYFHPELKPISNIIITTCPLAVVVMFCSRQRMILTYSINGQLIQRLHEKDSANLLVPTLIRDMRSLQYVVYGNEKGEIVLRDLPFLDNPRKFIVAKEATVTNICVSKDLRYLICSCSDGEMSVITDPSSISKSY